MRDYNPYSYLADSHNAIDEYYKLKRRLERADDNCCVFECENIQVPAIVNYDELRTRLIQIKIKKRYSYLLIAEKIGLNEVTIMNFCKNTHKPHDDNLFKIIQFIEQEEKC